MRPSLLVGLLCIAFVPGAFAQAMQTPGASPQSVVPDVVPLPAHVQLGTGQLLVNGTFTVAIEGNRDPLVERAAQRFLTNLSRETGIPLRPRLGDASKATLILHGDHGSHAVQQAVEEESYTLDVTESGAKLTAPTSLGILHGLETILQLVHVTSAGFAIPALHIEDAPRFPWRGLMIDVSRHFQPLPVLRRNIDAMAAVKLNVFHWHLSDNQGFRVESKVFPKLQQMGSDGNYYTQDEVRDLIAYAHDRGIRVVPEFDMPGHATAWFVGYPELASGPGPYSIEREWGVFDPAMDPTREQTYKFLEKLIGEMAKLFPDAYFHVGGDEVNGKQWDENPKIQAFMRAHGLKDDVQLQLYFMGRVQKVVAKHHKIMIGWDEILGPGLPKESVIQSWRGQDSLAAAAQQGYKGILSHGYYLDLMAPASEHYLVDPLAGNAASLTPDQQKLILGGEACMWTEWVTPENIDSRIWPRMAAMAERFWSPQDVRDVDSMYRRISSEATRLRWLGIDPRESYSEMLSRIAGSDDDAPLRVLAAVVEPVKGYARENLEREAGFTMNSMNPLDMLVDAVPPESDSAREFSGLVNSWIAGQFKDAAAEAHIRAILTAWRDNDARLQPVLANSFLTKGIAPLSQNLAALGAAGLQALDFIDKGQRPPDAWNSQSQATIQQATKPQADLLLPVTSSVQALVQAAASLPANGSK
jgi:hexosaminidase